MTDAERLEELVQAVTAMRQAQREYFCHRSGPYLRTAQAMERQVDKLIGDFTVGQRSLFPAGGRRDGE